MAITHDYRESTHAGICNECESEVRVTELSDFMAFWCTNEECVRHEATYIAPGNSPMYPHWWMRES